ncbi:MAG: isoprenylcysteine carboxylmethyltransferase family protein [Deltaproteobacteria bacterium]|nr:isoprenylcysteine carboxylmethyltransferase family protein [Deltaproteobacteria bacterium]
MIKWIVFVLASLGIVLFSWKSLPKPQSHGFYRFFALELILILLLNNVGYWFEDRLSFPQLISWFLLAVSLLLAIHGFYLLRVIGKPQAAFQGSSDLGFENTTHLVTMGAYRYIRHPLYASLLLLAWGIFFKHMTWFSGALALGISAFLVATAKAEEKENFSRFGEEYSRYRKTTKMFIPGLI